MKRKKGQTSFNNVLMFGIFLVAIIAIGLIVAFASTALKIAGDNILPLVEESAPEGLSEPVSKVVTPAKSVNNAIPAVIAFCYVLSLVGCLGIAYAYRITGEKYMMVFFFALSLIIIFASIISSQVYQDFHDSNDFIGQELQEQQLLSFFMLYSPIFITIICFLGGAIMFSGFEEVRV